MRFHILSDLHVDVVGGFAPQLAPGADAVICAGDVCEGIPDALAFLRRHIPEPTPIVFVPGNHEFYRHAVEPELAAGKAAAAEAGIHLLDDDMVVLGGVRIVGATLWTDFCLDGEANQQIAMLAAADMMNDYRAIRLKDTPWSTFRPSDSLSLHRASRAYLWQVLSAPFAGPTVVVTHHAPHERSIHERYRGNAVNAAFVSDQTAIIARFQPALWVHGHVHDSFDYRLGDTRVICNPRGYGHENPRFEPGLVVEV